MTSPRRGVPGWLLFVLLVVMPLLELFVLIRIGKVIGAGWTILALIAAAVLGAWLVKREGARAWSAFNGALAQGRMPTKELADGALVLVGGVLMMAPGVVSDAIGILLVLPLTRPLFRPAVTALVASKVKVASPFSGTGQPFETGFGGGFGGRTGAGSHGPSHDRGKNAPRPGHTDGGPVIRGEVIDD